MSKQVRNSSFCNSKVSLAKFVLSKRKVSVYFCKTGFGNNVGFLRQLLFTSAQLVVSNCGQGSQTRSFYILSETGSGPTDQSEVWKFVPLRMVTASSSMQIQDRKTTLSQFVKQLSEY